MLSHGGEGLVVGCVGAGKTLLLRQLEAACFSHPRIACDTQPTVGTELLALQHKQCAFSVREMGGAMKPLWPRYYDLCHSLVFVADTSSQEAVCAAAVELYNILNADLLGSKPILMVMNQRDRKDALTAETVRHTFRLAELEASGRQFHVCWTSAAQGLGIGQVLDWCANAAMASAPSPSRDASR